MPCRVNGIVWAPCLGALVLPRVPSGSAPSVLRQNQRRLQLHQLASLPQRQRQRRLQMNQLASLPAQQSLAPLQIVSVDQLKLEVKMLKQQVIDLLDELRGNVRLLLEVEILAMVRQEVRRQAEGTGHLCTESAARRPRQQHRRRWIRRTAPGVLRGHSFARVHVRPCV